MKKRNLLHVVLAALVVTVCLVGTVAAADTAVSISTVFAHNEKDNYGGNPTDMITGTGMNGNANDYSGSWPTNLPTLWTATSSHYQGEWQSQGLLDSGTSINGKIGWAIFDLGGTQTSLKNLYMWNVRENAGRRVVTGNIYHATTPTVAPTHGPTNNDSDDYDFADGGWTLLNTGGALTFRGLSKPPPLKMAFQKSQCL